MLNFIKAVVYGIVEGITEWLPVSSTGHMILLNELMPMEVSAEFWSMFVVVIQLGAIIAVVLHYWKTIWPLGVFRHRRRPYVGWRKEVLSLWGKIIVSCIPAGVVGVLADDWLDEHLYNWQVVSAMLILVGIAFLVVETVNRGREPHTEDVYDISMKDAVLIGLFQLIAAVFPGTSRSGATIIGGLIIGISRAAAADFTFILAIPVMAGSSLLKLLKYDGSFTGTELMVLLTGMVTALVVSLLVIRLLLGFIKNHDFRPFGIYRIVLGALVIAYFAFLR